MSSHNVDLTAAQNYYNFQGLDKLKQQSGKGDDQEIRAIAEQFESMFIQMMFKSMREASAVFAEDNPMNSYSSEFYQDMHDKQLSVNLAGQGGIGLADILVEQLKGLR